MRYIVAGDSMFTLHQNGVTHVFKSASKRPLQFVDLHENRGLVSQGAAHTVGSNIIMVSPVGMVLMDGNSGNMMQVSAVNRVLFDDWSGDLAGIESGYDSKMNTSYFLNPTDEEMIQICHSTKSTGLVKGANFVHSAAR
jgi:hypothetical protein